MGRELISGRKVSLWRLWAAEVKNNKTEELLNLWLARICLLKSVSPDIMFTDPCMFLGLLAFWFFVFLFYIFLTLVEVFSGLTSSVLQVTASRMSLACAGTSLERAPRDKWCTSAKTTKSQRPAVESMTAPHTRWVSAGTTGSLPQTLKQDERHQPRVWLSSTWF